MASPQLEEGYTRISNEILEAFARVPSLGSEAFQVLSLVLRYTYGFGRKDAYMSISFIAKGTGLKRRCVSRAIDRLVSKRLIAREESSIKFNKNYDEWLVSKRTGGVQLDTGVVSKRRTKVVSNRTPKKERIKKTNTNKESIPGKNSPGDDDGVNEIFDVFYETINPQINYGRMNWRKATEALIKKHGFDVVLKLTKYACSIQGQEFAPTITNPHELSEKLASLQIFIKKSMQPKKGMIQSI